MGRYASKMELIIRQSADWLYQNITDLCNKVIDSDSVEEEIDEFNQVNPRLNAYWVRGNDALEVADDKHNDSPFRFAIGKSLFQKDFDSSEGRPVLPIAIVIKSPKNAGLLLFYISLEELFEAMKALVAGDANMQIAILKDNDEALLSVNLDRKVDLSNLQKGRIASFFDLINGKYSRGFISGNEIFPLSVYYFYASDINVFSSTSFVVCIFLFFLLLSLSFVGCVFFWGEISKLLCIASGEASDCHFYLSEFCEVRAYLNSLFEESENGKNQIVRTIEENNKLKEMNNIYVLERINMGAVIDELTAEKEVLLIDKMVLEEKIEYLNRKAEQNA